MHGVRDRVRLRVHMQLRPCTRMEYINAVDSFLTEHGVEYGISDCIICSAFAWRLSACSN